MSSDTCPLPHKNDYGFLFEHFNKIIFITNLNTTLMTSQGSDTLNAMF